MTRPDDGSPRVLATDERVRLALCQTGPSHLSPREVLRTCRQLSANGALAADTYASLIAQGFLTVLESPFGVRLALTERTLEQAESALRSSRPRGTVLEDGTDAPDARPTLVHDLVTLSGLLARDGGRLTSDGLLNAPTLRKLEGLCLTPETAVPRVARRTPAGTGVWQFLLRFLEACQWTQVQGGVARVGPWVLRQLADTPDLGPLSLALFTFAASRLPTAQTAWLGALGPEAPVRFSRRHLARWVEQIGAKPPDGADATGWLDPVLTLLEATGLAVTDGRYVTFLTDSRRLWTPGTETRPEGPPDTAPSTPSVDPVMTLPDGRTAVDLTVGASAVTARLALEAHEGPQEVGQVTLYAEKRGQSTGHAEIGIGAICLVDASVLADVLAERLGNALLARWSGGVVVEPWALGALERAARQSGLQVVRRDARPTGSHTRGHRRAVDHGDVPADPSRDAPEFVDGPLVPEAALPWTLMQARQGLWRRDAGPGSFQGSAPPVDERPSPAGSGLFTPASWRLPDEVPPDGAPPPILLRWASSGAQLCALVPAQGGTPAVVLPLGLRWGAHGEVVDILDPDMPDRTLAIPLDDIAEAYPIGPGSSRLGASLTPAKARE